MSIKSNWRGPVGPLRDCCMHCQRTGPKLRKCLGCRVGYYCSRDHQVAHWPKHKSDCNLIQHARIVLAEEEDKVRHPTPDFFWGEEDAFETGVGHFWGLMHTRDYMRARYNLAGELLLPLGTRTSVKEALSHTRDMLRLCRSDNMGVREWMPAMMIRLDLDQEAYDFVKWWATCDPDGRYDWGDTSLPYLNVRDADVLEEPGFLVGQFNALNSLVAVLLLKLKLLVDIRNILVVRKVLTRRRLPLELHRPVELAAIRSPLSRKLVVKSDGELVRTEGLLVGHCQILGLAIESSNPYFTDSLLKADETDRALKNRPQMFSPGSWEDAALALLNCYAAVWETAGALNLLLDAKACAARDSERIVEENTIFSEARPSGPGSADMAKEQVEYMSSDGVWDYLDLAVENASYLGPWSKRPSERYLKHKEDDWSSIDEDEGDCEDYVKEFFNKGPIMA